MGRNPATPVSRLVQEVRHGRGALLMGADGVLVEQAAPVAGADVEAVAGEYASLLRHVRSLATELDWGSPKSFSVRGTGGQLVFAFAPRDLLLGVETGPTGLCGQVRYALSRALSQIGNL